MKTTLMMALTVDGRIGKDPDHFTGWTEKQDKVLFREITHEAGVVIMGSKTYDTIGKPLPGRKNIVLTRKTDRHSEKEAIVFTGKTPKEILRDLEAEGFSEVILAGGARINYLFAKENLIDDIIVTFSPKIFGSGLSLFSEPISMDLELVESYRMGKNLIYARYRIIK